MRRLTFLFAVLAASLRAAPAHPIEFTGLLQAGDAVKIALTDTSSGVSRWLRVGETYGEYTVSSYDAKRETVVLAQGGATVELKLKDSQVQHGDLVALRPLSNAQAQTIFRNLRQLSAAADQFYLEHGKSSATLDDLVGEKKYIRQLNSVAGEDYARTELRQGGALTVTTSSGESVTYDPSHAAKSSFYIVRAGDSGAKIARTYGVAAADLAAKNPDINFSRLTVGQMVRVR